MKTQKMFVAIILGFIVMFALAGVFHLIIMKDYFIEKMKMNAASNIGGELNPQYAMLSYFILAVLMAVIYPIGYRGGSLLKEGLIFGILMGLINRVPWEVLELGYGRCDWSFVITEAVWHSVEQGVGGIVVAYCYGKSLMPVAALNSQTSST